jgi:Domain of unknown function (DUF3482)/50S ribosome-binding GTPase
MVLATGEVARMTSAPARISLSLISHTNAGKTTLARTLLRKDVGEVRDAPHVTEVAEEHVLVESGAGDMLVLWDTPGFGDSARLHRRLEASDTPIGWALSQVWDRWTDRPFFSSQHAIRNVRDHADVVLYLVNAAEDPRAVGYVDAEMRILGWIGKPLVLLLNQMGPPQAAALADADAARWLEALAQWRFVRAALPLDAFARCWVQEHRLLDTLAPLLERSLQPGFARLARSWRTRDLAVFAASVDVIAAQLADAATMVESLSARGLRDRARAWVGGVATGRDSIDPAVETAMDRLARKLNEGVIESTGQLLRLHGLAGTGAQEILERVGNEYAVDEPLDPTHAGIIGGAVTGALGGLAADIAASGLTFGAGAVIGGVLGAIGASGATRAYNLVRGSERTTVRWSPAFLTARLQAAVVRYLAVAHFGRGRGEYVESECPPHWPMVVERAMGQRSATLEVLWKSAPDMTAPAFAGRLAPIVAELLRTSLVALYPASASIFDDDRPRDD